MAFVIVVYNNKGGAGKTTVATNLAAALNDEGQKTVMIDGDAQCNSSSVYGADIENHATLYSVLFDPKHPVNINDAIQGSEGRTIIAGDPDLLLTAEGIYSAQPKKILDLKNALETLDPSYKFVVIDTNPAIMRMQAAAVLAADLILIPIETEKFSLDGLTKVFKNFDDIGFNNLENTRLVVSNCVKSKRKLKEKVFEGLSYFADQLGTKVLDTIIHSRQVVPDSQSASMVLLDYDPKCETSEEFRQLAREIIKEVK